MQFMLQSWPSDSSYIFIRSLKNGSLTDFETMIPRGTSSYQSGGMAFCIYMNANDYMEVWARQSGGGSKRHGQVDFEDFTKETGGGASKNDVWLKYPRLEQAGPCISSRV
jgi:hypothetical protein